MKKYLTVLFTALLALLTFPAAPAPAAQKSAVPRIEPQAALGAYMGLVEEHFASILRTTRALAQTKEAQSGKWESVKPALMSFSRDLPTDATVWYAMPDGSYCSTESGGLTDQNLKDRAYFPRLLAAQDVEGDLVISKSTGHRSVIVASPVTREDRVVAVIGVSVRVHLLSDLVSAHMKLPDNTYFYALDKNAKIVLHRYADRLFKNVDDVADESLGEEFRVVMDKEEGVFDYKLKGRKMNSIFQKSVPLGWYFFIAQEKK